MRPEVTTSHRQLRVDQYEEVNARQSNVYEVPVELVQHESMSPNVDIMQQAHTTIPHSSKKPTTLRTDLTQT
ncbi:hypothetical protein PoB_003536900 [Plakobranchus ocellatus]|uniref:Uncharacterized protein n=1 Tax=Plakobranchus ocellatus TaxID=259542 RepID=A0AAV4ARW3_9GAST|nr:hypothetical protein PoB_003536900 [Plakobranchus ocellatus]